MVHDPDAADTLTALLPEGLNIGRKQNAIRSVGQGHIEHEQLLTLLY